jgi:predicted nucleic acid-binding protein
LTVVIDASITLAWCFEDETTDATEELLARVLREGAVAPAHWPLEVANGLRSAEQRGRLDEVKLRDARWVLTDLPVAIDALDLGASLEALDDARRLGLTVYDAAYVRLARIRGLALATLDSRLADACRVAGVEVAA